MFAESDPGNCQLLAPSICSRIPRLAGLWVARSCRRLYSTALYHEQMRVLWRYREWVVDVVGEERAKRCSSLPLWGWRRLMALDRCPKVEP